MTSGCAPLGRVWVCGRSAGRSDSCASRELPSLAWLDNWQLRGIPCGPISSRVCKPHLITLPVFAGVRVLGVDEHVWHHQDRRRRGPRELTGIVDHSRGGSSHGPLEWTWSQAGLAPCIRTGWPSAANSFAPVSRLRRWIPSRGTRTPSTISSKTPPASSVPFTSSSSLATLQVRCAARVQQDTTGHRGRKGDPLYQIRLLLRASRHRLTPR